MAVDDIHAMSETLAADPGSLVFLPLAEALLARGDLARAARVAQRGATRHPGRLEAHDLVARVALAQGDEAKAEESWIAVLHLDPDFETAHRGLGLVRYRQGQLDEAHQHLAYAAHLDPDDDAVRVALDAVKGVLAHRDGSGPHARADHAEQLEVPAPTDFAGESPARLFDPILDESKQVALLLESDGLVSAGQYLTGDGRDLGSEIGAHLTGVSDEAERAMRHFKLGRWTRLAIETEAATIAMAPMGPRAVLVAASRDEPLGFVRRTLERCLVVARGWIGEGA